MSGWGSDLDDLARAVAQLLVDGPAQRTALAEPGLVMAARNAVVSQTRVLIAAANQTRHPRLTPITARDLAVQPVTALVGALAQLPPAEGAAASAGVVSPLRAATPVDCGWYDAVRACICLESYVDALGRLPEECRWAVLRDLTDIAAALPELDADLAASLPPDHPALRQLSRGPQHDVLRLAARVASAHLDSRHAEVLPRSPVSVGLRHAPELRCPTGVRDLPAATQGLAAAVRQRGPSIAIDEIRSVVRMLRGGLEDVAAVLERPASPAMPWLETARAIRAALPFLEHLRRAPVATFTPVTMAFAAAARDITHTIDALAGVAHRIPPDAPRQQWERLIDPAIAWLQVTPDVISSTKAALDAGLAHRNLLVPANDYAFETHRLRWQVARHGWPGDDDVLGRATAARAAVQAAADTQPRVRRGSNPPARAAGTGRARTQLKAVLSGRTAPPH